MKTNKIFCLCVFILTVFHLDAAVTPFLKKVTGKNPSVSRMRNIDFIYLINLDKRPDKYRKSIAQLEKYNIHPCRFSAVCGWDLDLHTINSVGVKYKPGMDAAMRASSYLTSNKKRADTNYITTPGQTYFVHCFSLGAIGCALSHLSVLKDAYDSGYETIWVMEDDIKIIKDPKILPVLIDHLNMFVGKGNWDILFTDRDFKNKKNEYVPNTGYARRPNFTPNNTEKFASRRNIGKEFRKIGARFGTTSMIISRTGMGKILAYYDKYHIFLPIDMELSMPNDINLYTVQEDVVGNLPDASSNNSRAPPADLK